MGEASKYRYTVRKGGDVIVHTDCVHVAKGRAERERAELWRNTREGIYLVTDYGKPPGE
jgi:hypothetical protein